jgi:transcriptional regulator with XRE-family HTH domain
MTTKEELKEELPEALQQTIADRLNKSLKYAGMSHNEMAEYLEIHRNTLGGYCTGKTQIRSVTLRVWAMRVGLPIEWLQHGTWPETEPEKEAKPAGRRAAPAKKVAARKKAATRR